MGSKGDRDREARARERDAADAAPAAGVAPGAGDGGGGGEAVPQEFLDELVFGEWTTPAKPELNRAFNIVCGPEFDPQVIADAMMSITGLTDGAVGYVMNDPTRPPEIEFVCDPNDPWIVKLGALAVTYQRIVRNMLVGSRIVYVGHDRHNGYYWPESPKVARHELGHATMGFGHVDERWSRQFGPMIMGGADHLQEHWHPYEKAAWIYKRDSPPRAAGLAMSVDNGLRLVVCK